MRTTIDKAGRIVVPKKLRERLGLVAGTVIEIEEVSDGLHVVPVDNDAARIVDRGGVLVIEGEGWPSTVDDVRDLVEDLRDRR
jgi:AbrB family looped-hinge helix DNA binding protein